MEFDWDDEKASFNVSKHGVSFDEAVTVFTDAFAVITEDVWHSEDGAREIIIGYSHRNPLLFAGFVQRGDRIRLITARPATSRERQEYEADGR